MFYVKSAISSNEVLVFHKNGSLLAYFDAIPFKHTKKGKKGKARVGKWFGVLFLMIFFGIAMVYEPSDVEFFGYLLLTIASLMAIYPFLLALGSEIAITDKRVLAKTGFISRHTVDISLTKLQNLEIRQSVLARIFRYGEIEINGFGVHEKIPYISNPIKFKKEADEYLHSLKTKKRKIYEDYSD